MAFQSMIKKIFYNVGVNKYNIKLRELINIQDYINYEGNDYDYNESNLKRRAKKICEKIVEKGSLGYINIYCSIDYINNEINITKGAYKYEALLMLYENAGELYSNLKNKFISFHIIEIKNDFIKEAILAFSKKYYCYTKNPTVSRRPYFNENMLIDLFSYIMKKYNIKTTAALLDKVEEFNTKTKERVKQIKHLKLDDKVKRLNDDFNTNCSILHKAIDKHESKDKLTIFIYKMNDLKRLI
jgi:hypothetical protein